VRLLIGKGDGPGILLDWKGRGPWCKLEMCWLWESCMLVYMTALDSILSYRFWQSTTTIVQPWLCLLPLLKLCILLTAFLLSWFAEDVGGTQSCSIQIHWCPVICWEHYEPSDKRIFDVLERSSDKLLLFAGPFRLYFILCLQPQATSTLRIFLFPWKPMSRSYKVKLFSEAWAPCMQLSYTYSIRIDG